jgi:hypothetical protein
LAAASTIQAVSTQILSGFAQPAATPKHVSANASGIPSNAVMNHPPFFVLGLHKQQILTTTSQISSHFNWLRPENSTSNGSTDRRPHQVKPGSKNQIKFFGLRFSFVQICSLSLSRRFLCAGGLYPGGTHESFAV